MATSLFAEASMATRQSMKDRNPRWSRALPVLSSPRVTLRALRATDAPVLLQQFGSPNVSRYIVPPPSTLEGMREFIRWTHRARRQRGTSVFGVLPAGSTEVAGVMQLWKVERDFSVAECGFVLGERHWGSGVFTSGAHLLLGFAFDTLGVHRLEARAVVSNTRGNRALRKLGAVREGRLRGGFKHGAHYEDYVMWSVLAPHWRDRLIRSPRVRE
jgi:[ribosomal protein S5]-alanine N-acetyltransferase